jgi:probable HAF family extracellular repeat protein
MPFRRMMCRSAIFGLVSALSSCTRDPLAAPRGSPTETAAAAKAPAGVSVTSANPPFGDLGTTVNVHVFGSGFGAGAQATWLLHGVADPTHIRTNSTTVVSSTELIANITISADAQLAFWDVQVALGGKNGVGSECFEVTSAQILGSGTLGGSAVVNGMNDKLQVVGYSTGPTNPAFVYDDAVGMVNLGGGQAVGIDPLGTIVLGRDANFFAEAWVRQPNGSWVAESMTRLSGSIGGNAQGAARAADGTLLVVGYDAGSSGMKKSDQPVNRPVIWTRTGTTWSAPLVLTLPAGAVKGGARNVNGRGQIVGRIDASDSGAVWDTPTTPVRLDGLPVAINAAGTLIVGARNSIPVYWWRTASGAWNPTGVPLPTISGSACTGETANGVNSAGVIVGSSCNGSGRLQATAWLLDLSGPSPVLVGSPTALPGLGDKTNTTSETSSAKGVTETAPYIAAGSAALNGTRLAVRWQLR